MVFDINSILSMIFTCLSTHVIKTPFTVAIKRNDS